MIPLTEEMQTKTETVLTSVARRFPHMVGKSFIVTANDPGSRVVSIIIVDAGTHGATAIPDPAP
jgi:hypothetical protein